MDAFHGYCQLIWSFQSSIFDGQKINVEFVTRVQTRTGDYRDYAHITLCHEGSACPYLIVSTVFSSTKLG